MIVTRVELLKIPALRAALGARPGIGGLVQLEAERR